MIRLAMLMSIILLTIFHDVSVKPGQCEETCPLIVTEWSPKIEEIYTRRPNITAVFKSECGVDIDISSIQMIVDGEMITPKKSGGGSEVTVTFIPYLDVYDECEVTVRAQDGNGKKAEKAWIFEVPYWVGDF